MDRREGGRIIDGGRPPGTSTPDAHVARGVERPDNDVLEQLPREIAEHASDVGRRRLDRSALDILITALIGGVEVSLGGLAAAAVMGATLEAAPRVGFQVALALGGLVFPIGFLFVIIGSSELFTENFLIPVVAVFNRQRRAASLIELWGLSWLGNAAASAVIAALLSVPDAIDGPVLTGYRVYTEHKLAVPPIGVFASAVLAGMIMTALTWQLLAVTHPVARIAVIFAAGFPLFAANLSHSIVSASLLFVGFGPGGYRLEDVLGWLAIATAGNLIGGVALVTLFRIAQAKEEERQRARSPTERP